MCDTCRPAMLVVVVSAGMKRTSQGGGGDTLQDHERMFQPPVTQIASVEQQEPKQAGSEVMSDTDILFTGRDLRDRQRRV